MTKFSPLYVIPRFFRSLDNAIEHAKEYRTIHQQDVYLVKTEYGSHEKHVEYSLRLKSEMSQVVERKNALTVAPSIIAVFRYKAKVRKHETAAA